MTLRSRLPVAVAVLVAACAGDGRGASPTGTTGPTETTAPTTGTVASAPPSTGVVPVGFGTVAARVTAADGTTCDVCLWLAETSEQHVRGLMGVTDLGGADGMLFHFPAPRTGTFWMRDTPMPLSIVFYGADGEFVSSTDMEPCLTGPGEACARYAAGGDYVDAIEVPQGGLDRCLMVEGSRPRAGPTSPCPLPA